MPPNRVSTATRWQSQCTADNNEQKKLSITGNRTIQSCPIACPSETEQQATSQSLNNNKVKNKFKFWNQQNQPITKEFETTVLTTRRNSRHSHVIKPTTSSRTTNSEQTFKRTARQVSKLMRWINNQTETKTKGIWNNITYKKGEDEKRKNFGCSCFVVVLFCFCCGVGGCCGGCCVSTKHSTT